MSTASVEVVGLVYRSPRYLRNLLDEIPRYLPEGVTWRIVGNDPTPAVVNAADEAMFALDIYNDPKPDDWYLSRVYRAWNYCLASSAADAVCLVNSDMIFSPGWLDALIREYEAHPCLPTSRLVEPCKHRELWTSPHCIQMDLGRHPDTFPRDVWEKVVAKERQKTSDWTEGGAFMPCLLNRKAVLDCGGYPEGNILDGEICKPNPPRIIVKDDGQWVGDKPFFSGDAWLFRRMADRGFKHVTCYDSLVYHIQEGEMCP